MFKKISFMCIVVFLFSYLAGCGMLAEHAAEMEATGKALTDSAPLVTTINPAVGVWVLIVGGLLIAAGKAYKSVKKEK